MSLTAIIALLQAALTLLTLVSTHPELGQSARENAMHVAQQAITAATQALASNNASTNQSTYNGNVSDLLHSQTCLHVDTPTCSTYGIATFDSNGCVTKYTCAPAQTTTNTNTSAGASCIFRGQTFAAGQTASLIVCPPGCFSGNEGTCLLATNCGGAMPQPYSCHNGQWVSQTQSSGGSCIVSRHCGNLAIPDGGCLWTSAGVINLEAVCTHGELRSPAQLGLTSSGSCPTNPPSYYTASCPGDLLQL